MTESANKKRTHEVERVPGYLAGSVVLPVLIPIAAAIGTGFVIVNVSRVLLAVSANMAAFVAIALAVLIVTAAGVVALRPKLSSSALVAILTAFSLGVGTAGFFAARAGEREIAKHGEEHLPEGEPTASPAARSGPTVAAGGTLALTAKNFRFDLSGMTLPAGKQVTVRLANEDADLHNFALYRDTDATDVVFRGETFKGPKTQNFTFTAPAAGTYFFRCDVHPSMAGTATVA